MRSSASLILVLSLAVSSAALADDAVAPKETIHLFNGKDLAGWTTWLKATKNEDPDHAFRVTDGVIHMQGGDHRGYLATKQAYKDYHFTCETKWGARTDGGKYVRNSGVMVHCTGADGSAGGSWVTSLEVQLAQGCEGDFIVIRGKDEAGKPIEATISSKVRIAEDKKTRWDPQGKLVKYTGRQFWWNKHQPFFEEMLDTRGKDDVASPVGQWTKVEVIARGDKVTVKINGTTVNEALEVFPASGRIALQNEGHEVYFRNVTIAPLKD
ncbi:MAG: DUF1080 domain-containing protein [Phycisphaeraceae bacterium]